MASESSSSSFGFAASAYDPFNFSLTPNSAFSNYHATHGASKAYIADDEIISFEDSENVSDGIYKELQDNTKNGKLSENALAFRCRVFKSTFGAEIEGPKSGGKGMPTLRDRDEDLFDGGSGEDDELQRPAFGLKKAASSNDAKPRVQKPAAKKKIGAPAPRSQLPGLSKTGGFALKSVTGPSSGNGVRKIRRTTGRGKVEKRAYRWKDPTNKNKKKFYEDRALEAGVSIEEYLAANNIAVGSTANLSDRTSVPDDLFDEDQDMEDGGFPGNESDDNKNASEDEVEEGEEDGLFVDPNRRRANGPTPMMTARRVAMLASQYINKLYEVANSEPIDDVTRAIKSGLDKIRAGAASQLNAVEKVELCLAVERYESMF